MKKFSCITLGCKVNQYESNAIRQAFESKGYEYVDFSEPADIYVVNTCTVTNESSRKSRQMIRKAKKNNDKAIVIAAGCLSQLEYSELSELCDIVIGNREKNRIVEIAENYNSFKEVSDISQQTEYEDIYEASQYDRTRAYVKIEDGCNNFCSYCIIPFARGRVRSRNPEQVKKEIIKLTETGIKEVVLTGIHLDSYGTDLLNVSLIDVMEDANEIKGLERLRLSSLEPLIIDKDFIKRAEKLDKLCPHFHLSLQSGSNDTLKRMNRKYTKERYFEAVQLIRETFNDASLTTDVIVGFPGETEKEFEESYEFVEKVGFLRTHVFKFSPKKGTKAYSMDNQIDARIKEERSMKMIELSQKSTHDFIKGYLGEKVTVLCEQTSKKHPGFVEGHTANYIKVMLPGENQDVNSFKDVILENIIDEYAKGRLHVGKNI